MENHRNFSEEENFNGHYSIEDEIIDRLDHTTTPGASSKNRSHKDDSAWDETVDPNDPASVLYPSSEPADPATVTQSGDTFSVSFDLSDHGPNQGHGSAQRQDHNPNQEQGSAQDPEASSSLIDAPSTNHAAPGPGAAKRRTRRGSVSRRPAVAPDARENEDAENFRAGTDAAGTDGDGAGAAGAEAEGTNAEASANESSAAESIFTQAADANPAGITFGPHLIDYVAAQPFPLDDFQLEACSYVEAGEGVLVCAPTGAGKTVVGEFAVYLALAQGTKCFYTTPIKALSNQKYHDLVELHGEEKVGLLTGDVAINRDADIVVMTTEVLRNMMYADAYALRRLSHVVMDEVHFLADASRGAVWEEVILGLPQEITLIGLSATVSNSEEFGAWLSTVRGSNHIVMTEHRPVPLDQWMLVNKQIYPLLDQNQNELGERELNPKLEAAIERMQGNAMERADGRANFRNRSAHGKRSGGGPNARGGRSSRGGERDFRPIRRPEVIRLLERAEMLPAITFIFSRRGCEQAVVQCLRSQIYLTDSAEAKEIARIVDEGVVGIPEVDLKLLNFRTFKDAAMRGFAAHHAGMLPAFRHIVEKLFQRGLVRAVFATETLALGINMPARTVVLERLIKYNGVGHVDVTPAQFTQMTGRAGRRGIDTMGNAVVLWEPTLDVDMTAQLATTRTYPLISTFAPGYNMSVNLLKTYGYAASHRMLEKSFAQYQTNGDVVAMSLQVEKAEDQVAAKLEELQELLRQEEVYGLSGELFAAAGASHSQGSEESDASGPRTLQDIAELNAETVDVDALVALVEEYVQLRRDLKSAEDDARRKALSDMRKENAAVMRRFDIGDVVALPGKKQSILGVVVGYPTDHSNPNPWITLETGWSGRVSAHDLGATPMVVGKMKLARETISHPRRNSHAVVRQMRGTKFSRPKRLRARLGEPKSKQVAKLKKALRAHAVHNWPVRDLIAGAAHDYLKAQRTLAFHKQQMDEVTDTLGATFDAIIGLLQFLDYVEVITPEQWQERRQLLKEVPTEASQSTEVEVATGTDAPGTNAVGTSDLGTEQGNEAALVAEAGSAASYAAAAAADAERAIMRDTKALAHFGGIPVATDEGERLALIHNENDLLVAQCLKRGIWDELDPAELAALASTCTFEVRKETNSELDPPTEAIAKALSRTWMVYEDLREDQQRFGLPPSKVPEAQFVTAIHQWAAGAPLAYCLQAAAASGAELTPGDFVRSVRLVIDLLNQIANTGYSKQIRSNAREAVAALTRGVVELAS